MSHDGQGEKMKMDREAIRKGIWVGGLSLFLVVMGGCNAEHDGAADENTTGSDTDAPVVITSKKLLMAHGYDSDKGTWDTYAAYAKDQGYRIYRYDLPPKGSIEERATKLAEAILQEKGIEDGSLIGLGHSLGGLDLRYVVTEGHHHEGDTSNLFYQAAQKIAIIYTLSSPHKGITPPGVDDATRDMQPAAMQRFNRARPHVDQVIEGRKIPTLAIRFKCGDAEISDGNSPKTPASTDGDGVVLTRQQLFNGAPYSQSIYSGKHTKNSLCFDGGSAELQQTEMFQHILDDASGEEPIDRDVKDIVFYEDQKCSGDEGGLFSSRFKPDDTVNCGTSDQCSNNAIRSAMLFPGIPKNTRITLYSTIGGSKSDDWAQITVKSSIAYPVCIESFEQDISKGGIALEYHPKDATLGDEQGLDGKVSSLSVE